MAAKFCVSIKRLMRSGATFLASVPELRTLSNSLSCWGRSTINLMISKRGGVCGNYRFL
jgi:hypothetical protein